MFWIEIALCVQCFGNCFSANGKQTERVLNWIIWTVFRMSNKKFSLFFSPYYWCCCCCNIAFYRKRFHPFFYSSLSVHDGARDITQFLSVPKKMCFFFCCCTFCSNFIVCLVLMLLVVVAGFAVSQLLDRQWDACISCIEQVSWTYRAWSV